MAKGNRAKTLAEQLADLDGPAPKDFDPEEPDNFDSESDDSGSDEENAHDGREHYVEVGKSKLRKRETVPLGPKYEGSRVGRDAVEEEDSDDPFSKGFDEDSSDEEDEEDEEMGEDESGASEEDEMDGIEGSGSEDDEDGTSATDLSDEDDEDDDEDMEDAAPKSGGIDRAELRKIMSEEQKTVAATISEAAKADAEKGRAVKAQRKTFDALLNTRIRLQKAIISTNSFSSPKVEVPDDAKSLTDPVRAAEEAACNLWNSLNDLRESLHTTRTGEKRKRIEISTSTPSDEIWSYMQSYESETLPHRQSVLEKWSTKARGVSAMPAKGRLTNTAQQTIVDVLSSQLADSTRLVQKTRTARSCAPLQAGTESADIFDDADFYGLLLKELLERRSEENQTGALAGMSFNVPITSHWQAAREAKTHRANIDVRASKGRKLRYTVHEKLQNYMAPEDRNAWQDRQADELFSSLFGQRNALAEEEAEERDSDEEDLGEQGLLLFGGKK
ncbi:Protein bfr2 [Lasiodiplodia theobromae]|uniref:Protein BFR2 n=1 Tax=Lasiodiplodia theobromae TaxID=45133 RepID=A0A5N5D3S3_9PEZI|nr:Protein bfr2 [Lasiodiplodia theobromae]